MKTFNNAFELLTDDVKEVENYMMRSNMMDAIVDIIKAKEWTQKEAAEHESTAKCGAECKISSGHRQLPH